MVSLSNHDFDLKMPPIREPQCDIKEYEKPYVSEIKRKVEVISFYLDPCLLDLPRQRNPILKLLRRIGDRLNSRIKLKRFPSQK